MQDNLYRASDELLGKFAPDGSPVWSVPIDGLARTPQFLPDGNLILFTWNAWVYVVDPADGTVLMSRNIAPWRTFPPDPICLTTGEPSDCAFVSVTAVDARKGIVFNTYTTTNVE